MGDRRAFDLGEEVRAHRRQLRWLRLRLDWQRRHVITGEGQLPDEHWLGVFEQVGKDLIALSKLEIERAKLEAARKQSGDDDGKGFEEALVSYLRTLTPDQRAALIASAEVVLDA